jgi:hypothetical protein
MPGAVMRCTRTRILWPRKALVKTPKGVIPSVCVKYRSTPQENTLGFALFSLHVYITHASGTPERRVIRRKMQYKSQRERNEEEREREREREREASK